MWETTPSKVFRNFFKTYGILKNEKEYNKAELGWNQTQLSLKSAISIIFTLNKQASNESTAPAIAVVGLTCVFAVVPFANWRFPQTSAPYERETAMPLSRAKFKVYLLNTNGSILDRAKRQSTRWNKWLSSAVDQANHSFPKHTVSMNVLWNTLSIPQRVRLTTVTRPCRTIHICNM